MSERTIPENIDPYRYAEQGLQINGSVSKTEMQRLENALRTDAPTVAVQLQFGVDEQGITFLKGNLQAEMTLQCQRCLEPFTYEIISNFALGIVNTLDEANALPDMYEPALAKDGRLALRELIEDELILNLPIIPRHDPKDCKIAVPFMGLVEEEQGRGENPFHVLESLKNKQ